MTSFKANTVEEFKRAANGKFGGQRWGITKSCDYYKYEFKGDRLTSLAFFLQNRREIRSIWRGKARRLQKKQS